MIEKISNVKLGIGVPLSFPQVPAPFFHTWVRMEKPEGFYYIPSANGPIAEMRNDIVNQALKLGCTHLVMLDTDMTYHPKTFMRLLELCNPERPVVGALCYRRYPPFDPLMYKGEPNKYKNIDTWEKDSLVEVDATGTGCIMVLTDIFTKMPEPWFRFRDNHDPEMGGVIGEDIGFCWDLRRAGYRIFVDTSIPSGHLTTMEVTRGTFLLYREMKKAQARDAEEKKKGNGDGKAAADESEVVHRRLALNIKDEPPVTRPAE